jgi:hypothetical protein
MYAIILITYMMWRANRGVAADPAELTDVLWDMHSARNWQKTLLG